MEWLPRGWSPIRWMPAVVRRWRTPAHLLHVAEDVGSGQVVVMVHGVASSSVTFRALVPLLSQRYRCVSIDILGFGQSPVPADASYTIEEHVAAMHATIKSLHLSGRIILVGHSLGALLVSRYAAVHPREVSRVVLVSPPIYLSPSELSDPRSRSRVGAYLRAYEYLRTNKEFTLANAAWISRALKVKGLFEISERNWNAFILSMQNCVESQTTVSDVAAITVPVDVVYGALDQFIDPGIIRIIEQMRHVTVHRVEVNDHLVRPRLAKMVARVIG